VDWFGTLRIRFRRVPQVCIDKDFAVAFGPDVREPVGSDVRAEPRRGKAHDILLRKSGVCAIDFLITAANRRLALAARLRTVAAIETEGDSGKGFFLFESAVTH
jgi:hypothetical protein